MAKKKEDKLTDKIYTEILNFILESEGSVKESVIRKSLKKDQGNMNRYLGKLEEHDYIKKIQKFNGQRGYNLLDITTVENLKNIKKGFLNIHLMEYTKAKNIIIKTNFPGIGPRHEKKYFVYMSLIPSLFDTFLNNEFELMVDRAFKLWQIDYYKDIISSQTDYVYEHSFLYKEWFDPSINYPRIEVSKDELQKILVEIPYPYEEKNYDIKKEIIEKKLLEKLVKVVLSKRPNSTKDQVQKEVSEKIIDHLFYTSPDGIFDIVRDQHEQLQKMYDKICKHFYEADFLMGKVDKDAETFVKNLDECIKNVNEAYNQKPVDGEPRSAENFQRRVDELDSLYSEWYEKCLQKDKRLT